MAQQDNTSPPSSFASKGKIILGVLIMMGISSIILLFGYFGVNTALSSFQPSSLLLNWETFVMYWSIIIPLTQ